MKDKSFTCSSLLTSNLVSTCLERNFRTKVASATNRNRSVSIDFAVFSNPAVFADFHFTMPFYRTYDLCSFANFMTCPIQQFSFYFKESRICSFENRIHQEQT